MNYVILESGRLLKALSDYSVTYSLSQEVQQTYLNLTKKIVKEGEKNVVYGQKQKSKLKTIQFLVFKNANEKSTTMLS